MPQSDTAGRPGPFNRDHFDAREDEPAASNSSAPASLERRLYRAPATKMAPEAKSPQKSSSASFSSSSSSSSSSPTSTSTRTNQTYDNLPLLETAVPIEHKYGDPLQNISRSKVVELLTRQIEISNSLNYPLALLLMEFSSASQPNVSIPEPMQRATAKVLLSTLRATDLVLRFNERTLVAVLPEANENGATIVMLRLREAVTKEVLSSQTEGDLKPVFGVSGKKTGCDALSEQLLLAAESALARSKSYASNG